MPKTEKKDFYAINNEIMDFLAENDFVAFSAITLREDDIDKKKEDAIDFLNKISRRCKKFAEALENLEQKIQFKEKYTA